MNEINKMSDRDILHSVVESANDCYNMEEKLNVAKLSLQNIMVKCKDDILSDCTTIEESLNAVDILRKGFTEQINLIDEIEEKSAFIGYLLNIASPKLKSFLNKEIGINDSFINSAISDLVADKQQCGDFIESVDRLIRIVK